MTEQEPLGVNKFSTGPVEACFEDFFVKKISSEQAKSYIREKHYSKSCHNGPSPCYGLFLKLGEKEGLVGVLCFSTPCSENVRSSVFGEEYKCNVIELHRLFIEDYYGDLKLPKNSESWFISRCLKNLKKDRPHTWAVITFADTTEGHTGVIYKATNAKFCGYTSKATFFLDTEGRLRHPRQNGVNITVDMAITRGWCPVKRFSKVRYLYLLPDDRKHKKYLEGICKL